MSQKLQQRILCLAIPLVVGALSGWISRGGMEDFDRLTKPPLSPPGWLFPVVWTILFLLMGFASYLVLSSTAPRHTLKRALQFYGVQLGMNFFWSIFFFNFSLYLLSFFWLVVLWCVILLTTLQFSSISKPAAYLMLPYLIWVAFAGYLNLAIFLLNG